MTDSSSNIYPTSHLGPNREPNMPQANPIGVWLLVSPFAVSQADSHNQAAFPVSHSPDSLQSLPKSPILIDKDSKLDITLRLER